MLRKEREAVPKGNGPVPRQEGFGSGELTLLADVECLKNASIDGTGS